MKPLYNKLSVEISDAASALRHAVREQSRNGALVESERLLGLAKSMHDLLHGVTLNDKQDKTL